MYALKTTNYCCSIRHLLRSIALRSRHFTKDKQYSRRKNNKRPGNGNLGNGTVCLRRLDTGPSEQPASLVIQTAHENYLFNCGENFERSLHSAGVSSGRIAHAFLTQRSWSCLGGIVGLQVNKVASTGALPTFHGPENLWEIVKHTVRLSSAGAFSKNNFSPDIVTTSDCYEDKNFRFDTIPIKNAYHTDREVYAYLCVMKPTDAQISAKRIFELDIPYTAIVRLNSGEDVTLDDGRLIQPADLSDARDQKRFLIVDIPSKAYLNDFVSNEQLRALLDEHKASNLDFIVHLSPATITGLDEYQAFIELFGAKRQFLASGTFITMRQVYEFQSILHGLDEDIHPHLGLKPSTNIATVDLSAEIEDAENTITDNCRKIKLHDNDKLAFPDEQRKSHGWVTQKTDYEINTNKLHPAKYPHIVFLGTSSGGSTYTRNPTSILVNINESDSVLLDCGAATCSQLNIFYGGDESEEIYKRLKGIFISHMHADHYMGLLGLLRMRKKHRLELNPLRLIGPAERLGKWLSFASENIELIRDNIRLIDSKYLMTKGLRAADCDFLGIDSFRTCLVPHCDQSYAASLTFPYENNVQQQKLFKLTFSGDTVPCKQLVHLGQDSTLLIHEATFPENMRSVATTSKHSTVSQAIQQAQQMNAEHTILTHFSGRSEVPLALDADLPATVGVAFDFMQVCYDDLPRLNGLIPKYREAFRQRTENTEMHEFCEQLEDKSDLFK